MNVLVACEESQVVTIAFRKLGFRAFSCDVQKCSGGRPGFHIQSDVLPFLDGNTSFVTCDGRRHNITGKWDLIIAHPPGTFLSKAGSVRMFVKPKQIDYDRYKNMLAPREFFMRFYNCNCDHVCIENPIPMHICDLPYPTQVIQPYFFGDPFSKKTYLWTKGLPKLVPTDICESFVPYLSVCSSSKKMRSKTFPGIANAFAHQFSAAILSGNSFSLPYQTFLKDVIL